MSDFRNKVRHKTGNRRIVVLLVTFLLFLLQSAWLTGCRRKQMVEVTGLQEIHPPAGQAPYEQDSSERILTDLEVPSVKNTENGASPAAIAVYVRGAVRTPGVYHFEAGTRVYQVIEAAGGFTPEADTEWLNQAQIVSDGTMVTVYTAQETDEMKAAGIRSENGEGAAAGVKEPVSAGTKGAAAGLVNLNSASREELMALPGIGESKADSIIRYREENGAFSSTEEIMNISGIKSAVYSKIQDRITV